VQVHWVVPGWDIVVGGEGGGGGVGVGGFGRNTGSFPFVMGQK